MALVRASAAAPAPASPAIALRLLGDPAVIYADGRIKALERRAAGLLALVALEPGVTRARAAALLWPQSDNARQALRQQIARFRRIYGTELTRGDDALFIAEGATVDALQDGGGTLLGDLVFDDCEDFADWLARQRARRRSSATSSLARRMAAAEADGDLETATRLAEQLLMADNDSEAHHRALIRLHYLRGDVVRAQAAYDRLAHLLRSRFGARPSEETEQLARALRAVRPVAPQANAPTATRPVPVTLLRPPRMIGRAREIAALAAAWQEGRAALLIGEPGLGKTRLLSEFAAGRRILFVQGRPGDAGVPYATLARLLRTALAQCEVALTADQRLELARVTPELAPGVTFTADGPRIALQASVEALLSRSRVDAGPLQGVIVDDLHFVDEATLEMLQSLVSALANVLGFAFAQRPGEGSAALAALRDALEEGGVLTPLVLAPLTEAELGEFVDSLQIENLDAPRLASALARHTGGNPLFALETIKQALAGGQLRDGRLPQPGPVGTLIERRLKQLSDRALTLARVAAIAGPDFGTSLAEYVTGERAIVLADAWNELQLAQVLRETTFAHDLVADAVLRSVPAPIAQHLHRQIAQWLTAHEGEPARVARHWLAAGCDAEAVEALQAAAARASAAGRVAEGGRFLLQAAQACDRTGDAERAFDLTFRAAAALSLAVPISEFLPIADELQRRARSDAQRAAAHLARAHVLIDRNALQDAASHVTEGLEAARRAGRRDLEAELTFGAVHLHLAAGDLALALETMQRLFSLMRGRGLRRREADKLISLGTLQGMAGHVQDALRTFAIAHRRLREPALEYLQPVLLASWAVYAAFAGDAVCARARLAECEALLQSRGIDEFGSGHLAAVFKDLVLTRLRLGDTAQALGYLQTAQAWPVWKGIADYQEVRVALACLMLELGRPERLGASLGPVLTQPGFSTNATQARIAALQAAPDEAAAFWDATPDLARACPPVTAQCMTVFALGDYAPPARALNELERLLAAADAGGWHGARVALRAKLAAVRARAGQHAGALEAAAAAEQLARSYASMASPVAAALDCAEAFERCGRSERSRECLQRAAALVRQVAAALPSEFRGSYLQRNPQARLALEAASRAERLADGSGAATWLLQRSTAIDKEPAPGRR